MVYPNVSADGSSFQRGYNAALQLISAYSQLADIQSPQSGDSFCQGCNLSNSVSTLLSLYAGNTTDGNANVSMVQQMAQTSGFTLPTQNYYVPSDGYFGVPRREGEKGEGAAYHDGIDLCFNDTNASINIMAPCEGIVTEVGENDVWGNTTIVYKPSDSGNSGLECIYKHLASNTLQEGAEVKEGDTIGIGGEPSGENFEYKGGSEVQDGRLPHVHLTTAIVNRPPKSQPDENGDITGAHQPLNQDGEGGEATLRRLEEENGILEGSLKAVIRDKENEKFYDAVTKAEVSADQLYSGGYNAVVEPFVRDEDKSVQDADWQAINFDPTLVFSSLETAQTD